MALLGVYIKIYIVTLDELVYLILLMMKHDTKLITFPSQSISDIDNISNVGLYSQFLSQIKL
jgi:hypothetical protein